MQEDFNLKDCQVRLEKSDDAVAIEKVTKLAFENQEHSDQTEHLIIDQLRKSEALTISLVAELNQEIIGHVAISPVSIADQTEGWFGLGPISVLPSFQGKGIGTILMKEVLSRLENSSACGCVLLGDPNFYKRFGFKADSRLEFPGPPQEYFQSICFQGSFPEGEVTYHASFYGVS